MELTYKYHGKPKRYLLVNSIAQMSPEQRLAYYNFLMGAGDTYSIVPILWQIPLKELSEMDEQQRHWLYESIQANFEKPSGWLIPTFENLTGPADNMSSSTWAEWYHASIYINKYRQSKDSQALRKFLASLYHERGTTFDLDCIQRNAPRFHKATPGFIFAAILSFSAVEDHLKTLFPFVFPSSTDDQPLEIAGTAPKLTNWLDITYQWAELDPVKLEAYQQKNLYLILKGLNLKIEQNLKLSKK